LWALGRRTLKAGALVRLADLRVRQGRYDEAAGLLDGLDDPDAARVWAALYLARGENALALDLRRRALQNVDPASSSCVPLLAELVDAELACGHDTDQTIRQLEACAEAHPSTYANALLALAKGRAGAGDPRVWLRDAFDGFTAAGLPWEAALCRLELAIACRDSDPELAVVEAQAALRSFETLASSRHADAARSLLRELGARVAPPRSSGDHLTKRELEVVQLLGAGLSNPEISQRLFISRKTVEHHVGNILAKLGLRNRAEIAAYAVRREPADK
jgi:DNA-binding CsgD family transcriptional regulator